MKEKKRDRERRKQVARRKQKAREQARQSEAEARLWRSYDVAQRAREHLERGEIGAAVRAAARAAALNPSDPVIGRVYLAAAERSRDVAEQARALAYMIRLAEPDARHFIQLADLWLRAGDAGQAREATARARALLPRRMKERRTWVALLERIEAGCRSKESARADDVVVLELPLDAEPGGEPGAIDAPRTPRVVGPRKRGAADVRSNRAPAGVPAAKAEREPLPDGAGRPAQRTAPAVLEIPLDIAAGVDGLGVLALTRFSDPEAVELAVLAARIRDAETYDTLFSIERARGLVRFSHQEETARRVLAVCLGRALLADEVGLGKTIEAGLVLSEYLLRGRIQSALVLVPPTLVAQWREELESKFDIPARTTDDPAFRSDPARFWSGVGVVIASLATARSIRQRELVVARPWDLLIVDEAHVLKKASTESYRLVARVTSRFLLLLTATPVENKVEELFNLVSLIRPGLLGGRTAFLRRFSDAKLRSSEAVRAEVRSLLGEVMVRNTRALSGVRLPPRFARTLLVQPDAAEAELYGHIAAALRQIGTGGRTRLLLSVLLQEAGSSPYAVRPTLERLRDRDELAARAIAALAPAIRCAERPITTGKAAALLRVIGGAGEPAVVFTRFRATLDFLATILARNGVVHERLDGNVPLPLRHEAIRRLRERGGVLLATDVGAEGLNLQFCRRVVNFDLPWNPMRIEQRIGRVHRIGQEEPVDVVNFCLAGSIEERILGILDERINLFELVVGEMEMILGYLEDERAFDDLVFDAFADDEPERRERSFARITDALQAARARYESVKRFDEEFFRNELGV